MNLKKLAAKLYDNRHTILAVAAVGLVLAGKSNSKVGQIVRDAQSLDT